MARVLLYDSSQYFPGPLFSEALEEISLVRGDSFRFFDEYRYLKHLEGSTFGKIAWRLLGRRPTTYWELNRHFFETAKQFRPDVVLVVKGAYISASTLQRIKKETHAFVANYAPDDPFNPLVNSRDIIKGLPFYDFYACVPRVSVEEVKRAGCPNAAFVMSAYKPSVHYPEKPISREDKQVYESDLAFVGTATDFRVAFFEDLTRALPSLRLSLYGANWNSYPSLARYYRGLAIGRAFRLALGGTKISIHLLTRENRGGHSMKTFEIPTCGAFLLAERTQDHTDLFEEGKEAEFFGSRDELQEKITYYLEHDAERERIAEAGHRRVASGKNTYRDRLIEILQITPTHASTPLELTQNHRQEG